MPVGVGAFVLTQEELRDAMLLTTIGHIFLAISLGLDALARREHVGELRDGRYGHAPCLSVQIGPDPVRGAGSAPPRCDSAPVVCGPMSHGCDSCGVRRLAAARGGSLRYLVPDAVARYIVEHSLYRQVAPAHGIR